MTNDNASYDIFAARPPLSPLPPRVYMAVRTTGIFCRPGCPARMPKPENCEFFKTIETALAAGYRACKRCHPSRMPGEASDLVKALITLVEQNPEQRWSEADLKARGIDSSTARRQFNARFGMSFSAYARARRLGLAAKQVSTGESIVNAQITAGYESASGFRTAFAGTFGTAPKNAQTEPLLIDWIDTPLGPMVCVCDARALYLLEFTDRVKIERQFARLTKRQNRAVVPGVTTITEQTRAELSAYFAGELREFSVTLATSGTDFQSLTWRALQDIPYGQTRSYAQLAVSVGNAKAVRAVAGANANNGLAIIIPCHRVIATGGGLGGYAGNLSRKAWLLEHEAKHRL